MGRTEEQNERMRAERRRAILSSAGRLFATRGLAATKVSDIAAACGMSQGLLYHYFSAKEEIFTEIIRTAFAQMNEAARELARAPEPPHLKLAAAAAHLLRSLEESEDFAWFSVLISQASLSDAIPEEAQAIIRREREVPYQVVADLIREGQAEGRLSAGDADERALAFWAAIKGLALHKTAIGGRFKAPHPERLVRLFT